MCISISSLWIGSSVRFSRFQIYELIYDISDILYSIFKNIHINPNTTNLNWIPVVYIWSAVKYIVFYSKIFSSILILCSPVVQSLTIPPLTFHIWVFYWKSCLLCPSSSNWRNETQTETWIKNKKTVRTEFNLQGFARELYPFCSQGWCIRVGEGGVFGTCR